MDKDKKRKESVSAPHQGEQERRLATPDLANDAAEITVLHLL